MLNEKQWMQKAIEVAKKSLPIDVPVGALVVNKNQQLIASAHNNRERENNLSGHAEIIALDLAAKSLNNWRLTDCTLYVTLEPCPMCAGAIIQSQMSKVVFGAYDSKAGAFGSYINLGKSNLQVIGGILEDDCSKILKEFFQSKRPRLQNQGKAKDKNER